MRSVSPAYREVRDEMRPLYLRWVSAETLDDLDEIARRHFRTRSDEIRFALSEHVHRARTQAEGHEERADLLPAA